MYLSRLILNPLSRQVQKEIAEPYQMHRTILQFFADPANPEERVLFRVDPNPRTSIPTLLMQSQQRPIFDHLPRNGRDSYLFDCQDENPAVKTFEPKFHPGQVLSFRLLANPTIRREKKRRGLLTPEEQASWIKRKASAGGFQMLQLRIEPKSPIQGPIFKDDVRHDLMISTALYEGLLAVSNAELFLLAVKNGIGSAKGLGCGLLSIVPAL